ncbi:sensor domain-containing diguanylate cyclase [Xanthobacter sp. KR7-65]|uniref:sensor domain-containing diguanylate cyclase n=1 Tax=Xanthobacter sp. KR7-65 TaxID=3156612 RepID=UPI0032B61FE5
MKEKFAKLRDRLSVRQQTTMFAALLCITTALAVAISGGMLARRQAAEDAQERLATLAATMASRLDQHMFERYREIRNIAGLAALKPTWTESPAGVRAILAQIQSSLPDYAWIGFAGPDGIVRAATNGLLEGVSVAQRPWFVNGLKGPAVEDVHDAKLLDQLLRKSPDEAPFRFVDVAVPVYAESGALLGVLGAHLSWTWADRMRELVLSHHLAETRPELLVFGRMGNVLIGPPNSAPLSAEQIEGMRAGQTLLVVSEDHQAELRSLAPTTGMGDYPGMGWIVVAQKPLSAVLGPANNLFLLIIIVGSAVAVAAALLARGLVGRTMRPLEKLTQNLDLIGRDKNARTIPWQRGSRDVFQLSSAIRSLLRRVDLAEEGEREARKAAAEEAGKSEEFRRRARQDMDALQQLARTDTMTGLLNRRGFLPAAERAMDMFNSGNARPPNICMVDIDHFKHINDQHGHAIGDKVICAIGSIIAGQVRQGDSAARFGGEEFIVLAEGRDAADAFALGERIRETIAGTPIALGGSPLSVTVSVGVAIGNDQDRDVADVIERADRALYDAKRKGRNRTVAAEEQAPRSMAV